MVLPLQQDHERLEAAEPPGAGQATVPNQPQSTTSPVGDGSTTLIKSASNAPTEDVRNPIEGSSKADHMNIEDADTLAMQVGSTGTANQGHKRSVSEPLQINKQRALDLPPKRDTVMRTTMSPDEMKEARKQWREAGRPNCLDCGDNHAPPCDPDIAAEKRRLEDLKTSNPGELARVTDARKVKRRQKTDAPNQANAAHQQKQNEIAAADGKPTKTRTDFRQSLTNPGVKPPKDWCMRCLTCHPRQNSEGSFHTLTWNQAEAIHREIQLGKRERVNPLEQILAVAESKISFLSKPAAPTTPRPPIESTFEISEDLHRYLEQAKKDLGPKGAIDVLCREMNYQAAMQTAASAQPYGQQPPYGHQQPYDYQQPSGYQQPYASQQSYGPQQPYGAQQPYVPSQGSYANPAPAGSYQNFAYPPPGAPAPRPTEPLSRKRKAEFDAIAAKKNAKLMGRKPKFVPTASGGEQPNPQTSNDDSTPTSGTERPEATLPAEDDAAVKLAAANDEAAKSAAESETATEKVSSAHKTT